MRNARRQTQQRFSWIIFGLLGAFTVLLNASCGRVVTRGQSGKIGPGGRDAAQINEVGPLAPDQEVKTLDLDGIELSIREVKPSFESHSDSSFTLGEPQAFKAMVKSTNQVTRVMIEEPLVWPTSETGRLAFELSPYLSGEVGQWSYRCKFADGRVAEDSQQEAKNQSLVVDRAHGKLLLLLDQVFGEKGDRHDPASQCQIEIRRVDQRPLVVVIRMAGPLPELVSTVLHERSDFVVDEEFLTEQWTNSSSRRVAMRMDPKSSLDSRQRIKFTRITEKRRTVSETPEPQVTFKTLGARGFDIEAKVNEGQWEALATLRVIFEPKESKQIRFRIRLKKETPLVSLRGPVHRQFFFQGRGGGPHGIDDRPAMPFTLTETDELIGRDWVGALELNYVLEEVGDWGSHSKKKGRVLDTQRAPTEAFDEWGWVS
ncbi:MAG: hypothetical protein ACK5QT_00245 [Oligoflexia bacterium]